MAQTDHPSGSITAIAPCRIDLAGGTLDIWPLYLFHSGAVTVNFAVNILTRCTLAPRAGNHIDLKSADRGKLETFRSLEELCGDKKLAHPLAAQLVRDFAATGVFSRETHHETPDRGGISG